MFYKRHLGILVLLLSIFSILPLFHMGVFPIHDDTQVARVYEMGNALKDGMFPVRWVSDLGYGYGYPIFNFYAPFAYYIGGFLTLVGFNALLATKIMMGVGIIFAGISMYFLAREFWGEAGGIISSLLYVYAPYHAVEIYVRGDVGEFYAYSFIPLIILSIYKVFHCSADTNLPKEKLNINNKILNIQIKNKKVWKWIVFSSLSYAAIILSHNLTALMVTPFLLGWIIILSIALSSYSIKLYTIRYSLYALILGLMISAFYWVPALLEMKYTNVLSQIGGGADFKDHFVCVSQLWNSPWGFGGSTFGCLDGMSFKIGKFNIFLVLLSIFLFLLMMIKRKQKHFNDIYHHSEKFYAFLFAVFGLLISIFLILETAKPIWEIIRQMAFFQYPWRFLILISFFSSFLTGFIFYAVKDNKVKYLGVVLTIIIIIATSLKMFTPQTFLYKPVSDFTDPYYLKWTVSKISDEYLPENFRKPEASEELPKGKIQDKDNLKIDYKVEKTQNLHALVNVSKPGYYPLNIAYFPAWKVFLDNKEKSFEAPGGRLLLKLDKGNHVIDARFEQTPVEKVSNMISFTGLAVLILGIIVIQKKRFYL